MLEISHVKKSFGKNHVLRDVSMKVNKGDVIVILGPSGSGKTTLLRSLVFWKKRTVARWTSTGNRWT